MKAIKYFQAIIIVRVTVRRKKLDCLWKIEQKGAINNFGSLVSQRLTNKKISRTEKKTFELFQSKTKVSVRNSRVIDFFFENCEGGAIENFFWLRRRAKYIST